MKCFCKECGGGRGWIWDLPTEAIDNGAMNIELLNADGTSFVVDCYSVAGQCKLRERHKQAWNQTEQTERRVRSGSARWLACSVRLARWPILAAQAQLSSAEPNRAARLLALGRAYSALAHLWLLIGYGGVVVPSRSHA